MDDEAAKQAASENADAVKTIDVELTVEEYGIAVKKGDSEMVEKINNALQELKDEGEFDKLLDKYSLAD